LALDGGIDGLAAYRLIAAGAMRRLRETGVIAVEIGSNQAKSVIDLLSKAGFSHIRTENDLAGLDRVVLAHHP
jgi:release factor glutamine methyltransferase